MWCYSESSPLDRVWVHSGKVDKKTNFRRILSTGYKIIYNPKFEYVVICYLWTLGGNFWLSYFVEFGNYGLTHFDFLHRLQQRRPRGSTSTSPRTTWVLMLPCYCCSCSLLPLLTFYTQSLRYTFFFTGRLFLYGSYYPLGPLPHPHVFLYLPR